MSFAGEPNLHGRPSLFTREQHRQALSQRREGKTVTALALRFGISHGGMSMLLKRAEQLERVGEL